MILSWIRAAMDWFQLSASIWMAKLKYTLIRASIIVTVLLLLLWISVFFYGSFYYAYMPSISHIKPVHMQYSPDCEYDILKCPFPRANLSLVPDGKEKLMITGQPYHIILVLDMPESPVNQDLGVFMVKLQFYDRNNQPLHTSSRPALLKYKSSLLQIIETCVYAPFFLSGAREQKQSLHVELFSDHLEHPFKPSMSAIVEIQSKTIQIYSASLKIFAHFTGLRFILFNYPLLSAVCGIGTNMMFLMAVILLSWYRYVCGKDGEKPVVVKVGYKQKLSLEERRNNLRAALNKEKNTQSEETSLITSEENSDITPLKPIETVKPQRSPSITESPIVPTGGIDDVVNTSTSKASLDGETTIDNTTDPDLEDESIFLLAPKDQEENVILAKEVTLLDSQSSDMELRRRHEHQS